MNTSKPPLSDAINSALEDRDGRLCLSCHEAFRIAREYAVEMTVVGQHCNEQGIKIVQCQLGCFP